MRQPFLLYIKLLWDIKWTLQCLLYVYDENEASIIVLVTKNKLVEIADTDSLFLNTRGLMRKATCYFNFHSSFWKIHKLVL